MKFPYSTFDREARVNVWTSADDDETDRRAEAVAQLVRHGQLDLPRRQELSVVLNRYQARV